MMIERIYNRTLNRKGEKVEGELPVRSFLKALSWRAVGTLDTIIISWIISGNVTVAFSIGAFELITKTFLYYFHERMWNYIKWGK